MSDTFKIPLDIYYQVSGELKAKVTELADSVEDDFLNKVSANIGFLDGRDASIVEGFSSYTSAKKELVTLREHESHLNNMSMEGGGNPLNGVVSTDDSYASLFSGLADGSQNSQISSVSASLSQAVQSTKQILAAQELIRDYSKSISDNDYVQRLLMLAKVNPSKALEKLLGNEEFLSTIAKNGKIDNFFWKMMTYINDAEKVPEALMTTLANNSKFVEWAGKLSVSGQDTLKALYNQETFNNPLARFIDYFVIFSKKYGGIVVLLLFLIQLFLPKTGSSDIYHDDFIRTFVLLFSPLLFLFGFYFVIALGADNFQGYYLKKYLEEYRQLSGYSIDVWYGKKSKVYKESLKK